VRKDDVRGPLDVYVLDLSVPSFDRPDGHGTEADGNAGGLATPTVRV
jgi:hypothetical protein